MARFYFTYGLEGQPYVGGWTEVIAENRPAAEAAFRAFHPDRHPGLLNCSSIYDENVFKRTSMSGPKGNFDMHCHEVISIHRTRMEGQK